MENKDRKEHLALTERKVIKDWRVLKDCKATMVLKDHRDQQAPPEAKDHKVLLE